VDDYLQICLPLRLRYFYLQRLLLGLDVSRLHKITYSRQHLILSSILIQVVSKLSGVLTIQHQPQETSHGVTFKLGLSMVVSISEIENSETNLQTNDIMRCLDFQHFIGGHRHQRLDQRVSSWLKSTVHVVAVVFRPLCNLCSADNHPGRSAIDWIPGIQQWFRSLLAEIFEGRSVPTRCSAYHCEHWRGTYIPNSYVRVLVLSERFSRPDKTESTCFLCFSHFFHFDLRKRGDSAGYPKH